MGPKLDRPDLAKGRERSTWAEEQDRLAKPKGWEWTT